MKRFKKIIRIIVLIILVLFALCGIPLVANLYAQKRDDLFDNEIKIERVEQVKEKTELPKMNELR